MPAWIAAFVFFVFCDLMMVLVGLYFIWGNYKNKE